VKGVTNPLKRKSPAVAKKESHFWRDRKGRKNKFRGEKKGYCGKAHWSTMEMGKGVPEKKRVRRFSYGLFMQD